MSKEKSYVYSARTTEKGLGLLNDLKAKMGMGWDQFVNEAVAEHYGLDPEVLTLPSSDFLRERAERKTKAGKKAGTKKAANKKTGKHSKRQGGE